MISLTNLKKKINEAPDEITSADFLRMHQYVEGYLRRLQLIGLRLNNVQYATSRELIQLTYLNNRALLEAVFKLISKGNLKLHAAEAKHPNLKILTELFFNLAAIYRNRLVHGVLDKIRDEELLQMCYQVDRYLIIELERVMQAEFQHSAFDPPKSWGATTIRTTETIDQIRKRLKLGKIVKSPMTLTKAQAQFKKTTYSLSNSTQ